MIHALRKLARDIHRLALWQVVVGYAVLGWLFFFSAGLATARLGLPAFTTTMAVVIVALGFPMVVATAVVQGGLPGLRIEDIVDPNELEGRTPEEVHVIPEAHPMYGVGVLTWRNSILGGVMAVALLITSVVAYLSMWALGIGPVGSLLAQGALEEGDRVLVADLDNRTERSGMGRWIGAALRADLEESELVSVVPYEVSLAAAGDAAAAMTGEVARRTAGRMEAAAVVEGEVERLGSGFRVTIRVRAPPQGDRTTRLRETARTPAELVDALDLLAERLRAKLGEPLRDIRAGTPLAELIGSVGEPVGD